MLTARKCRGRFALVILLSFGHLARSAEPTPLWHLDLSAFGYNDKRSWSEGLNRVSLEFLSNQTLALTYRMRLESPLHAKFLDAATGMVNGEESWPAARSLLATFGGRFIVLGEKLSVYSAERKLLSELPIDCTNEQNAQTRCIVLFAPGNRILYVQQGFHSVSLRKLDSSSLFELQSWNGEHSFLVEWHATAAEDRFARTDNDFHPHSLSVREIGRPWPASPDTPLARVVDPNWIEIYNNEQQVILSLPFVTQNLIAIFTVPEFVFQKPEVVLLKSDGTILFRANIYLTNPRL